MTYIKRDIEDEVSKYLNTREIIAIMGPRQAGKTTLVNKLLSNYSGKRVNSISLDDFRQLSIFDNDIESFISLNVKGYDVLFIDEIQYSKDSGKKLKYIFDKYKIKIFISGSSSHEIAIQSLKYLTGRVLLFSVNPFSFEEFLRANYNKYYELYKSANYSVDILNELNKCMDEYLLFGGYPRVVLEKDFSAKQKILLDLYSTYALRDVKDIISISEDYKFYNLLKALALQTSNLINYSELSQLSGYSTESVKKILNILEKTYIIKLLSPYYNNKRNELTKSKKVYFIDLGFRNAILNNFSNDRIDMGAIKENFILSELAKRGLDIKYWRSKSGAEVDFIIEKNQKLYSLEIKNNVSNSNLTKSYYSFLNGYNVSRAYLLSGSYENVVVYNDVKVFFLPFVKFVSKVDTIW